MSSSAITTQVAQLKIGNVQNQADSTSVYNAGVWSFKNSTALTSVTITDAGAVTLGPSNASSITHFINGAVLELKKSTSLAIGDVISEIRFRGEASTNRYASIRGIIPAGSPGVDFEGLQFTTCNANSQVTAMTIDASGNLLVGIASGSSNTIQHPAQTQGNTNLFITNTCYFFVSSGAMGNAAATAMRMNANTTTSRSINASGTINANGADYAEYMTKTGDFTIAKGDICGINAEGKLTKTFSEAVTFVVKSTNPSYVGNDSWGEGLEADSEELEAARQLVDRIAFCGQVPVNVFGATPGQWIIPVEDNGEIKGEAVSSPSFEQYQKAVGKVIAIEEDGRARIIVKIA